MGRPVPTGNDANEWRLWLLENAASDVSFMAEKIAAAVGKDPSVSELMSAESGDSGNNLSSSGSWPRITSRTMTRISRWVTLMAREVEFSPGAASETYTFEFPGGIIDTAEGPAGTAARELLEETGFPSKTVHQLGVTKNDAGRLGNRVHSFFIETETLMPNFRSEDGITIHLVTPSKLVDMILSGSFDAQANLGTLLLAVIRGCFELPSLRNTF